MPAGAPAWDIVPVSGLQGLARCETAWRTALAEAASESLFMQPEWVMPWLQLLGGRSRALFATQSGRVRAAAILIAERMGFPCGPLVLRPPGLGVSDYLDLLLPAATHEAEAASAALLEWLAQAGGWDLLDVPNLPAESPTVSLLTRAANQLPLPLSVLRTYQRPYITLKGTWEDYLASRPSKLRYNLRARQRRLAALGQLRYRHYTRPDEVVEILERAIEVHARRWEGQHTSTKFSSSADTRRFYREACRRMAELGWVDLSSLELDGRLLAFSLSFVHDRKLYYYLPSFDPEYARFAPGTQLLAHLIENAFRRGLEEVDLMLGEESYKDQWANGSRATTRLLLAAPGSRGAFALEAFRTYVTARERARRSLLLRRARRYGLGRLKSAPWS